ncbi:transmembrane protein (macronuclear) [Tetrahymena thermophila SB210]|uniref:Transmembrane protein n=1 Tax=Tetrahymena thermophila (strain SB210) TaxID=312017 RepID=W7XAD4_TETTS|nr:transmembrane protein [Tetrahymena thermophila SB210]EWS76345.1 transmembrane protein [Tetrahymena thermophila SB210]|eukprot:XP_012651129.1 transmembrane protein [Tetrahymena thermophila SB210]
MFFEKIASSLECPFQCKKCQYSGNLDNKMLICLECNQNYKLSKDQTYCYSNCEDDRYYLDLLDYIFLNDFTIPQLPQIKTYDCVPSCDFKSYYTDQKTKSCIMMNICPNVNQYGFNFQGDLEAYSIKFSKKQNLLAAYFESNNYFKLWKLDNGEYIGEIQISIDPSDSTASQNGKLTKFFFGDKLLLEGSIKDKDILIGISQKNIYFWDTRVGSLIQQYNSFDANVFTHYFYQDKQYIFLLNPSTFEIFLQKLNNQQTSFLGFAVSSSAVQQIYNQYSNELACFGYSDQTNKLQLQVFFLDQSFFIGVVNKQIDIGIIEFISQLIVVDQNLYLILSNHIPYLVNSLNNSIQLIEIPLFSKVINVQFPFEQAINNVKLDIIKLKRDNQINLNLALVQQKSDSLQTSLTLNLFQNNTFLRVIEIIPEINIYSVRVLNSHIEDQNIVRLFCINDFQTKIIIYEIDLIGRSLLNTYPINQQFPIINSTLFFTGSWEEKELVFYNSQLLIFLQIKSISQLELSLNIKFEIRNYNQVHLINYEQLKIHKINKMYEDTSNNQFVYLNNILKEIRIVDLKKQEIVGKIIFQESSNCFPIDFVISQIQNLQFINILCDNQQIYIYDYISFQLVSNYTFYNADENGLLDFAFLQNFIDNGALIVFSSRIIIRLNISNNGKIINQIVNENFNQIIIKDIIYFADNQNYPKILYVLTFQELSILQINSDTLELYANRTQYKHTQKTTIMSYNIDYQKQQIGISCFTNEIIIFNTDLVKVFVLNLADKNIRCFNPRQIDEISIICNIQITNVNQSNKQNNFIGLIKNNAQINLFGSYFEDSKYFFDDKSKQLLYYTNLDNVNLLSIKIYANQNIYQYSNTYILTQDIYQHYYSQGSDRMFFAQNRGFDVEALHFDQQFEYVIKQIEVNDNKTIQNVIILNERNQLIEVKSNGFIIYTLSTNEIIYNSQDELEQCQNLLTNTLSYWVDDDFLLFICDFQLYQLRLISVKQYKIYQLKSNLEGIASYLYIQKEQKMIIQSQDQSLYLYIFYLEEAPIDQYTFEEYFQYTIQETNIISFMYEPNLQTIFCVVQSKISYYIYRFMLLQETPINQNSLIGDVQKLDQQSNLFILNSETKFLIIIMNKIIYVINLDNQNEFNYQQIMMQGVEQYQILSQVLILRNSKKILIFTIADIIQSFLNYQSNIISPQVTIKNNLIQTFLTIPDFQDISKWLIVVAVKLNQQTQIYIYDQTGQIIQSIPLQTSNDFASQLQYDVKSKILYICTQKGFILGIEATFGFLQSYQISTKYSLQLQYQDQSVKTQLYFFVESNQFIIWNKYYIGLVSITNFIEIPMNIVGRIKTSVYLSNQTNYIYLFDEANILWKLSFISDNLKYVYSFGYLQEQANIIYVDISQTMIIQQGGNIFVVKEGSIAYKYEILAQKVYKNVLILANNNQQQQQFQGLLIFTLDRKIFFLNSSFQAEEIYQFKQDQNKIQCVLPNYVVASDYQSTIIIFDKKSLKIISEIQIEEQSQLIEIYCQSIQDIFFTVNSQYSMQVFYVSQQSYNVILTYVFPYPFPFAKGKLQLYFENDQSRVFFIQTNKRQIFCYDYKLKVSINSLLIPPCPNFNFKITKSFIFLTCLYQFNLHFKYDMKYLMSIYTNESIGETIQSVIEISPQFIIFNSNYQISVYTFIYGKDQTIQVGLLQSFQTHDEEILYYNLMSKNFQIQLISRDDTQIYSRRFSSKVQNDHYRCYQDIVLDDQYQLKYQMDNIEASLSLIKPIPKFVYINCFFNYQFFFSNLGLQDFLLGIRLHQKEITIQDELGSIQNGFDPTLIENFNFKSLQLFELQNIENLKQLSLINIYLNLTRIDQALQLPLKPSYSYTPNQFQKQNQLIFQQEYITSFINQSLESIVLQNILLRNQTLLKTIYQIKGSQKAIIKSLVLNNINLKSSILFYILNVETVIIENLVIKECILDDSYLFFVENSVNLQIKNAKIFQNEIGYSSSLFYLANTQQNIKIVNLTLYDNKNSQKENDLLNSGRFKLPCLIIIQKVSDCQIQSLNFTNNRQVQLLFYSNQYQTEQQQIELKQDQIILQNLTLFNNIFEIEDQSNLIDINSLVFLKSIQPYIMSLDVQSNISPFGKGIINIAEALTSYIFDTNFYNNTSLEGGCLYIQDSSDVQISHSNFTFNRALACGGALYLKDSIVTLNIKVLFKSNQALIGGAIRLTAASNIQNDQQNTLFLDNKAEIAGNTIANFQKFKLKLKDNFFDYQQEERGVDYDYQIQNEQIHVIQFLRPGALLSFLLVLQDEEQNLFQLNSQISQYPQIIQEELQKLTIQIQTKKDEKILDVNSNFMKNLLSYSSIQNGFFLENIQFNMKQLLSQDQMNYYQQNMPKDDQINFQINIYDLSLEQQEPISEIQFAIYFRFCQKGEILSQNQLKHYQCIPCEQGSYSLQNPQIRTGTAENGQQKDAKCLPCPLQALSCFRNQIYLKNGFWRQDINDDAIYQCKNNNCLAQNFNQTKICNEGYTGPLCESCEGEKNLQNNWQHFLLFNLKILINILIIQKGMLNWGCINVRNVIEKNNQNSKQIQGLHFFQH